MPSKHNHIKILSLMSVLAQKMNEKGRNKNWLNPFPHNDDF